MKVSVSLEKLTTSIRDAKIRLQKNEARNADPDNHDCEALRRERDRQIAEDTKLVHELEQLYEKELMKTLCPPA